MIVGDKVILRRQNNERQIAIKQDNPAEGNIALTNPSDVYIPTSLKTSYIAVGNKVAILHDAKEGDYIVGTQGAGTPPPTPTLTSFTPPSGRRGKEIDYILGGTNFPLKTPLNHLEISLLKTGQPEMKTHIESKTSTEIGGDFTIPNTAELGLWTCNYHDKNTAPDLQLVDCFEVLRRYWLTSVEDTYVEDVNNHWSSNALDGDFLCMDSGILAGEKYVIASNTAHTRFTLIDLVPNGSFETGDFTSWTVVPGATNPSVVSGVAHGGNYSCYFYCTPTEGPQPIWTQGPLSWPAGTKLRLYYRYEVNLPEGYSPGYLDVIVWGHANSYTLNFTIGTNPNYPGWDKFEITLPYDSYSARFHVQGIPGWSPPGSYSKVWIDDIGITPPDDWYYDEGFRILDEYHVETPEGVTVEAEY